MKTVLAATILLAAAAPVLSGQEHRVEFPAPRDPVPTVIILPVGELAKSPARAAAVTLAEIAAFASRFVQPPLRGQEEIKSLGDKTMIGLLRPAQHQWLTRFVEQNKKRGSLVVEVQCRFVQMKEGTFQRLAAPLLVKHGKKLRYAVLAKGEKTTKFLANLIEFKGTNVMLTPRLVTLPTQRAMISAMVQTTYVKDFEAKFDEFGKPTSIEPVIGIAKCGMWLRCTCGFVEQGILGLSLQAHWSDLKQPIKEVELRIKECDAKLKIGVPELDVAEVEADVRMPTGGTVMFELPATKGVHQLVYLTATAVHPNRVRPVGPRK